MKDRTRLVRWLNTLVSETLGKPMDFNPDAHIQELGFDSKLLVVLTDKISEATNEEVHPGVIFEHSSMNLLADYLLQVMPLAIDRTLGGFDQVPSEVELKPSSQVTATNSSSDVSEEAWRAFDLDVRAPTIEPSCGIEGSPLPVVVGGGIAGLLISHRLSMKKIPHIVVGEPELGDSPKLGESMTEVVSIEFARNFPQFSQYFYPKECTPFYMGDLVAGLRFSFFEPLSSIFLGDSAPRQFMHVDRVGFDRALYQEVSKSPYCTWFKERVVDLEYCSKLDAIRKVVLDSGKELVPTFIWDCTNHVRLLGRKIGLECENIDARREVIFSHYYSNNSASACKSTDSPWMHATSLLRADVEYDGISGVSWLIPLGEYVSVGISMLPEDIGDRTSEEILALLSKAYLRRGLNFQARFPRRKEVLQVPSQHFMYERFVGSNWALVGGSGSSTWFTSGSNLSICAYMAHIADRIISDPETFGRHFTQHVEGFMRTQKIYDSFLDSSTGTVDAIKFLSGVVEQARRRISSFFSIEGSDEGFDHALAARLFGEEVAIDKNYFDFLRQIAVHATPEARDGQTKAIFEKFSQMKEQYQSITLPYLREDAFRKVRPELFQKLA